LFFWFTRFRVGRRRSLLRLSFFFKKVCFGPFISFFCLVSLCVFLAAFFHASWPFVSVCLGPPHFRLTFFFFLSAVRTFSCSSFFRVPVSSFFFPLRCIPSFCLGAPTSIRSLPSPSASVLQLYRSPSWDRLSPPSRKLNLLKFFFPLQRNSLSQVSSPFPLRRTLQCCFRFIAPSDQQLSGLSMYVPLPPSATVFPLPFISFGEWSHSLFGLCVFLI